MKQDEFGDRMKAHESVFTSASIPIDKFMCVRIDGKGFSRYTKHFKKPFDDRIHDAFVFVTETLVRETNANVAFTQSDEITLIYSRTSDKQSEFMYGGKVSKINSILSSMATASFNSIIDYAATAIFDCRTWAVDDAVEASNVLLWRAQDAMRNSVSSLFRWSQGGGHSAMHGKDQRQMKEHLLKGGVSWDDLDHRWKYGTFIKPEYRWDHLGTVERKVLVRREIGDFGSYDIDFRQQFVLPAKKWLTST